MDYKQDKINLFLYEVQYLENNNNLTEKQVYKKLIEYGIPKDEQSNIDNIITEVINKYKDNKKIQTLKINDKYVLKSTSEKDINNRYKININIPLMKDKLSKSLTKIIEFLIKNKIIYILEISNTLKIDSFIIKVQNKKDEEKITNFINTNKDIMNNTYELNPILSVDNKVFLSFEDKLSYLDILSKYIYKYITLCIEQEKKSNIIDFEKYMYSKYLELTSKYDLTEQIKIISAKNNYPTLLKELEDITILICSNLKSVIDSTNSKDSFYKVYEELNIKENNGYEEFSNESFNNDNELLKEIITRMSYKYGYDYTKKALNNYRINNNPNGIEYISRDNNLREKVQNSKSFRTYINGYSDEEFETKFERIKPELSKEHEEKVKTTKEMILEEVCKETYLACETKERNFTGKQQVAIALIRMSKNDYSLITRQNNAREVAKTNIKPNEVVNIIKRTIETNGYILENEIELYELYTTHIENLCKNRKSGKGRK